jgi:hypothetical protein
MFKNTVGSLAVLVAAVNAVDIENDHLGNADPLFPVDDIYEPCDGLVCPDGSVLDEDCCKCIVEPCFERDCKHDHEWWNPVTCKCECKLLRPGFECPEGSRLDLDCCECIVDVCDKDCWQGYLINEQCEYVPECPEPPTESYCAADAYWDTTFCMCRCSGDNYCDPDLGYLYAGQGTGDLCVCMEASSCQWSEDICASQGLEFSRTLCACVCVGNGGVSNPDDDIRGL